MSIRTLAACLSIAALAVLSGCNVEPPASPAPTASAAAFEAAIAEPGVVLVKFGAPWCGPCVEVDRELEKLRGPLKGRAEILTINVDESAQLAQEFQISGIPHLILFKDGSMVDDRVGYLSAEEIEQWISQSVDSVPEEVSSASHGQSPDPTTSIPAVRVNPFVH